MAATLLDIKSKMLLPAPPEEEEEQEDPRAELVQQLLEYKMYKCISYELKKTGRWTQCKRSCLRFRPYRRRWQHMKNR